ncbi:hypothetical protein ABC974_13980 [Sphingomonas oligophenolica]|uniref:Uncharacterized protein n=1 Tax=Sphingomonas oligophenolica TaxID=301154 RepID=A0ABU9Y4K9_9SPHN
MPLDHHKQGLIQSAANSVKKRLDLRALRIAEPALAAKPAQSRANPA